MSTNAWQDSNCAGDPRKHHGSSAVCGGAVLVYLSEGAAVYGEEQVEGEEEKAAIMNWRGAVPSLSGAMLGHLEFLIRNTM